MQACLRQGERSDTPAPSSARKAQTRRPIRHRLLIAGPRLATLGFYNVPYTAKIAIPRHVARFQILGKRI